MPPLAPDHLSPTGSRINPLPPATYEFSDECVSLADIRPLAIRLLQSAPHKTSDRMADRIERFAADCAAARAASSQAAALSGGTMREQKETAQ